MQVPMGRFDLSRDAVRVDSHLSGFASQAEAADSLVALLQRLAIHYESPAAWLDERWKADKAARLR